MGASFKAGDEDIWVAVLGLEAEDIWVAVLGLADQDIWRVRILWWQFYTSRVRIDPWGVRISGG